jgi:hypothetical protein
MASASVIGIEYQALESLENPLNARPNPFHLITRPFADPLANLHGIPADPPFEILPIPIILALLRMRLLTLLAQARFRVLSVMKGSSEGALLQMVNPLETLAMRDTGFTASVE